MQRLTRQAWACKARFKLTHRRSVARTSCSLAKNPIALKHALKVKSAEFWLKLGQPDQALREIKSLPEEVQNHPSVIKAHLAIVRAAWELNDRSTQA